MQVGEELMEVMLNISEQVQYFTGIDLYKLSKIFTIW